MSPAVARRLMNARQNFNGRIEVVEDRGDTAIVMIIPANWNPFAENDDDEGDWGKITEPTLMLIDPARADEKDGTRQ